LLYAGSVTTKRAKRTQPLALGYVRVSTDEQVNEGASLAAQRAALIAEATRRGWDIEIIEDEGVSAKNLEREGLQAALGRLDAGEANVLLAVRLDRISRSVADFSGLIAKAQRRGWDVRLLSPDLDTKDPSGKFTAHVLAAAAEYERELIRVRTREGMAQKKAEGVHVGRPTTLPDDVIRRILAARADGKSLRVIADALTADAVATAQGGKRWHASTVKAVLGSTAAQRLAAV